MPITYTWPLVGSSGGAIPLPSTLAATPTTAAAVPVVRDLALDQVTGDLVLTGNDINVVADLSSIVQDVRCHLQFFQNEWFLNNDAGLPYFQSILGKGVDVTLLRALFRTEILSVVGINEVTAITVKLDGPSRTLSVVFTASSDMGELRALLLPLTVQVS